jgi:hypothetical protein
MTDNNFERKIYDLEKELQNEIEIKKILHEIYFSNLEENIHLFLNNRNNFLDDLYEKINFCLYIQFSKKFFESKKSKRINEEFKEKFEENIFRPIEKFIDEEISKSKSRKKNYFNSRSKKFYNKLS